MTSALRKALADHDGNVIDLEREFRFVTVENRMERMRRECSGADDVVIEAALTALHMERLIRRMDADLREQMPSDMPKPGDAA